MPTQRLHAWLDPATAVPGLPRRIRDEGVDLPVRSTIDMVGDGVTATDDEAGDRTVITIPGQTPWTQDVDAALHDLNSVGVVRFGPYTGEPGPDAGIGNEAGTLHILTDNGGSVNIESFGNGRVLLSTDGTRRLVVHQNGKVGIGPSMNPAYTLDVQGDCNVSGVYRFPDGTTQATAAAAAPVASVFGRIGAIVAQAGDYVVAQITGAVAATRRIIAGAGLLGGGDLSGDVTLSVDKAAVQSPWVADVDAAGKSLTSALHITAGGIVRGNPIDSWSYLNFKTDQNLNRWAIGREGTESGSNNGSDLAVYRYTDAAGFIGSALLIKRSSGNVGIGTADPQYRLDVAGGARFTTVVNFIGPVEIRDLQYIKPVGGGGPDNAVYNYAGTYRIQIGGTDRLLVAPNGNVGIGVDPQYKLDVAGTIRSSGYVEVQSDKALCSNLSFDGSNWRYIANGPGILLLASVFDGAGRIMSVPAGTAGTIASPVDALRFSGNDVTVRAKLAVNATAVSFRPLAVADAYRSYAEAAAGGAALSIGTGVGQTDDGLLFGVSGASGMNVPYSWIQAVQPGTAQRALLLNPVAGVNAGVVIGCPEGTLMDIPNGTLTFFKSEASNQLRIRVKYTTGTYKDAVLTLS